MVKSTSIIIKQFLVNARLITQMLWYLIINKLCIHSFVKKLKRESSNSNISLSFVKMKKTSCSSKLQSKRRKGYM